MPGVKFIIDADAAKAVQEFLRTRAAEKQVDDGLKQVAASARAAGGAMTDSARGSAREYELASASIRRNVTPLPRTADPSLFRSRGRGAVYDVAATSSVLRAAAPTIAAGADTYGLARTDDEKFSRYLRAEQLRGDRRTASFMPRADASMGSMNALANRARSQLLANAHYNVDREDVDRQKSLFTLQGTAAKARQDEAKSMSRLTAGLMGVGLAVAYVDQATDKYRATLTEAGDIGIKFEGDMRGLLSLGDNAHNGGALRKQVLAQSNAFALDTGQVAGAQFMLNSAASNLGGKMQGEIFNAGMGLNQVAGGDLQAELVAVTKLMQTYGAEMGSADLAASKLLATEDKAAITLEELAQLLPDILPAAKLMGHTYDEVAASVITATQVLGNNDKTLTALRNTFLKLGQAEQEGLVHHGKFVEQLEELSHVPPVDLERIFGERTVTLVAALSDHLGDMKDHLREMEQVASGEVMKKFLGQEKDTARSDADVLGRQQQTKKNAAMGAFDDLQTRDMAIRLGFAQAGITKWKYSNPTLAAFTPETLTNIWASQAAEQSRNVANWIPKDRKNSEDPQNRGYDNAWAITMGVQDDIASLRAAGDPQSVFKANLEQLKFGNETGTGTKFNGGHWAISGDYEAQQYAGLSDKFGADVGLERYQKYRSAELDNDKPGMEAVLAEMGRIAAQQAEAARMQQDAAHKQAEAAKDNQRGARNRNAQTD